MMKRGAYLFTIAMLIFSVLMLAFIVDAHADNQIVVGLDSWQVPDKQVRYMPNYNTANKWQSVSQFVTAKGEWTYGKAKFSASGKMDSISGSSIDRLDIDYAFGSYGVRAGIVPYRISWCRTYDADSPYIQEADAFCRSPVLNEISRGAAGVQAYKSWLEGDYLIDSMIGYYNPLIDNQDKSLGPYKAVGPTVESNKFGGSVNMMKLSTGTQVRLSYLHSTLKQNDTLSSGFQRHLEYDTLYIATESTWLERLQIRASWAAYLGNQLNIRNPYEWTGTSATIEGVYSVTPQDTIAVAASYYDNVTEYVTSKGKLQNLSVPSYTVAWRHRFDDGYFGILQLTQSTDDYTTLSQVNTYKEGVAFGLRLGKVF